MTWIILILMLPYYILKWIFWSPIEWMLEKKKLRAHLNAFQNYDNLSKEERENQDSSFVGYYIYDKWWGNTFRKKYEDIVKHWYDKKIMNKERCEFVSSVDNRLLQGLLRANIPLSEKDYEQTIAIYSLLDEQHQKWEFEHIAKYALAYWQQATPKPIVINNMPYDDGVVSYKDLLATNSTTPLSDSIYFHSRELIVRHKGKDLGMVYLYSNRLECYKSSENDVWNEDLIYPIVKKGNTHIINLEDITDIKCKDPESEDSYNWHINRRIEKEVRKELVPQGGTILDISYDEYQKLYDQKAKEYENLYKDDSIMIIECGENIYNLDGDYYCDAIVLRALLISFLKKQTN